MITSQQRNLLNRSSFYGILLLTLIVGVMGGMSMWTIFRADDRLPIDIRNIHVITPKLKSGQPFVYEFDYDKRKECHPPKGAGEVSYRVWLKDSVGTYNHFLWVDPSTISYADPEVHHRETTVDMPRLVPGQYMMQYRARYVCEGASKILEFDGPLMPFEIVK